MKLRYNIEFIPKFVLYCLYQLSKLMHRQKDKWVFGSHFGFKDNSKFLLFDVIERHPEIKPVWISQRKSEIDAIRRLGIKCYYWLSLKGLYHSLTAKVFVCTRTTIDINRFASGGALYLNLNHGVGLKKCYWQRPDYLEKTYGDSIEKLEHSFKFKVVTFPWYFRVPDICLVPSKVQAEMFFMPAYRIPESKILYANFPRNELLRWSKSKVIELSKKYEPANTVNFIQTIEKYDKVYIYMPTWRNDQSDFLKSSGIELEKLNTALARHNDLLIIKLHPLTKIDSTILKNYSNVLIFPSVSDVYYVMPFTDCLITDYSSIYSDYVMMNKEIILFPFDMDNYLKNSTSLGDYDKYYKGRRAVNFNQLLTLISERSDCHLSEADYKFLMDFYWGSINNGADIIEETKKRIN